MTHTIARRALLATAATAALVAPLFGAAPPPPRTEPPPTSPPASLCRRRKVRRQLQRRCLQRAGGLRGRDRHRLPRIPADQPDRVRAGRGAADPRGADTIIVVGFYYAQPLSEIAPRHPDVRFTMIERGGRADNVQSVLFREQEVRSSPACWPRMASETGTIGFVRGDRHPADPEVHRRLRGRGAIRRSGHRGTSSTSSAPPPAAFNDPTTANELTVSQIERGADVVFAGAGNSKRGIFQAAVDNGVHAIGVDSNQNGEAPGTILTSMLKRVDVAALAALNAARDGTWQPGVLVARPGRGRRGLRPRRQQLAADDAGDDRRGGERE